MGITDVVDQGEEEKELQDRMSEDVKRTKSVKSDLVAEAKLIKDEI